MFHLSFDRSSPGRLTYYDSQDLIRQLRGVAVHEDDRFLKIDIKDYFMSGDHHQLVHHSSEALEDPQTRQAYQTILGAILRNQLISVEGVRDRLWTVEWGTGMGLMCSGDVSDTAFHYMVEDAFITDAGVRRRYGVTFYGRIKDDIFIILDGIVHARQWGALVREMRVRSQFFKLKVESLTSVSAIILDVELKKDSEWRRTGRLSHY